MRMNFGFLWDLFSQRHLQASAFGKLVSLGVLLLSTAALSQKSSLSIKQQIEIGNQINVIEQERAKMLEQGIQNCPTTEAQLSQSDIDTALKINAVVKANLDTLKQLDFFQHQVQNLKEWHEFGLHNFCFLKAGATLTDEYQRLEREYYITIIDMGQSELEISGFLENLLVQQYEFQKALLSFMDSYPRALEIGPRIFGIKTERERLLILDRLMKFLSNPEHDRIFDYLETKYQSSFKEKKLYLEFGFDYNEQKIKESFGTGGINISRILLLGDKSTWDQAASDFSISFIDDMLLSDLYFELETEIAATILRPNESPGWFPSLGLESIENLTKIVQLVTEYPEELTQSIVAVDEFLGGNNFNSAGLTFNNAIEIGKSGVQTAITIFDGEVKTQAEVFVQLNSEIDVIATNLHPDKINNSLNNYQKFFSIIKDLYNDYESIDNRRCGKLSGSSFFYNSNDMAYFENIEQKFDAEFMGLLKAKVRELCALTEGRLYFDFEVGPEPAHVMVGTSYWNPSFISFRLPISASRQELVKVITGAK